VSATAEDHGGDRDGSVHGVAAPHGLTDYETGPRWPPRTGSRSRSSTRYEWVRVDFAVMCAGAATITVYPKTNAGDVAFIIANSGSRVVVAEDQAHVDKLIEPAPICPTCRRL
jgi:hypothetical protein